MLDGIGLAQSFLVMGGFALVNAVFGFFFIPNTRGRTYEEIQKMLSK